MKIYKKPKIYIVAGEPSGDILGDQLIKSLQTKFDSPIFNGVGGEKMQSNNFRSLFDMSHISIFGIFPVIKKLFFLLRKINDVVNDIVQIKPDIIILIDSPDFNHRVAKKIKRYLPDIPIICYVAPTVWAWRHGRAKKMSKYFNYLLSVIPFEVNFFEKYGLKTTYVGHPFIEKVKKIDDKNFSNQLDLLNGDKTIIFLPGSRRSEIERHSPIMSQAIEYLRSQDLKINILIATGHKQLNQIREYFPDIKVITDDNEKYSLFKIADFACAASGTVTLELGLTETPTIVIYKMDKFTWFFISRMVKVKFVSLVNLILGRESSKELLQDNYTKENLIDEINKLLLDSEIQKKQIEDLREFKLIMKKNINNPSENASNIIKNILEN
ncbi:MAG: lipid-A-disaccharide synthase [Pseudomonadota bacterium]|jgi:lipid-A-disaccharide synthase|nr:lipid-A-disaccharide synthase [Pseudomonadota bacterium]MED5254226.1 lipid-A-disaccharide synthase [Pseudomonadota bacterium]MED5484142.1 lipid-A-disaccharide synthase [Pseudomonadota bacterium]|tara:strand:+ start:125 stop:1273 length:1149 start_codon:yes stop_codon:yes gene_type:complete